MIGPSVHRKFPTGARPSPRHKLLAAVPHVVTKAPPPQSAWIPKKLDMWGNDQYGDCVSAEEAFAKACYTPEIFIDAKTVEDWASAGGFLNGANLTDVMDAMKANGFKIGNQLYNDGSYAGVDYTNETVLQSAISQGPVKISIDSSALPSGAGNQQGWSVTGSGPSGNQDHCVALCGYGPSSWLYQQLGVSLPSGLPSSGYLLYTWSTIGFVDFAWVKSVLGEAWLRNPTTVGVPPLTPPIPPPPPPPPPGDSVLVVTTPMGPGAVVLPTGTLSLSSQLAIGNYPITFSGVPPQNAASLAGDLPPGVYNLPGGQLSLSSLLMAGSYATKLGPAPNPPPPPPNQPTKQELTDVASFLQSLAQRN